MATSLNGLRVADREIRVSLAKTASPSKPDHPAHPVGAPLNYVQAEAQARLRQYSTFHSMLNSSNIQTVNAVKPHKKARHDPIKVVRTIYVEGVGPDTKEQVRTDTLWNFGCLEENLDSSPVLQGFLHGCRLALRLACSSCLSARPPSSLTLQATLAFTDATVFDRLHPHALSKLLSF